MKNVQLLEMLHFAMQNGKMLPWLMTVTSESLELVSHVKFMDVECIDSFIMNNFVC